MKENHCLFIMIAIILISYNFANAQSCPKWGPYASAKQMGGDAELMMADVMIPSEGNMPYTYTCALQFALGKSGGYCGLQDGNGNETDRPFNNIFSVWDYPDKVQLIHTYKDPMTFVGGFGNEGTGLHSHCDMGWKTGQWYTHVVRRWYDGGDKTFVAYFIYDHTNKEWRHYVTFAVPEANAMLHGDVSSFLENFGDNMKRSRSSYYRSYWKLTTDGHWIKPWLIEADAGEGNWNADAFGDDGLKLISCGKEMINGQKKNFPVTSTQTTPSVLSVAQVYDIGGYYDKKEKKVYIDWSIKKSYAPQLSYEVELFDTKDKQAKPLASVAGYGPEIHGVVLTLNELSISDRNYYVLLKVKDIFGQDAQPKELLLSELKP